MPHNQQKQHRGKLPPVTGDITPWQTWRFSGVMAALFLLACAAMNPVCLALSPIALLCATLYSYIRRFTWLCHFALGALLAFVPLLGWLCVSPSFSVPMLLFTLAIFFWTSGFDILYSCRITMTDNDDTPLSLPARLGPQGGLLIAACSHFNAMLFFLLAGLALELSFAWHLFLAFTACTLFWGQRQLSPDNLTHVSFAFALNGPASILLLVGAVAGV